MNQLISHFRNNQGKEYIHDGCTCLVIGYTTQFGGCLVGKVLKGEIGFKFGESELKIHTPGYKIGKDEKCLFLVDI